MGVKVVYVAEPTLWNSLPSRRGTYNRMSCPKQKEKVRGALSTSTNKEVLHNIKRWDESSHRMSSPGRHPVIRKYAQRKKKKDQK